MNAKQRKKNGFESNLLIVVTFVAVAFNHQRILLTCLHSTHSAKGQAEYDGKLHEYICENNENV